MERNRSSILCKLTSRIIPNAVRCVGTKPEPGRSGESKSVMRMASTSSILVRSVARRTTCFSTSCRNTNAPSVSEHNWDPSSTHRRWCVLTFHGVNHYERGNRCSVNHRYLLSLSITILAGASIPSHLRIVQVQKTALNTGLVLRLADKLIESFFDECRNAFAILPECCVESLFGLIIDTIVSLKDGVSGDLRMIHTNYSDRTI